MCVICPGHTCHWPSARLLIPTYTPLPTSSRFNFHARLYFALWPTELNQGPPLQTWAWSCPWEHGGHRDFLPARSPPLSIAPLRRLFPISLSLIHDWTLGPALYRFDAGTHSFCKLTSAMTSFHGCPLHRLAFYSFYPLSHDQTLFYSRGISTPYFIIFSLPCLLQSRQKPSWACLCEHVCSHSVEYSYAWLQSGQQASFSLDWAFKLNSVFHGLTCVNTYAIHSQLLLRKFATFFWIQKRSKENHIVRTINLPLKVCDR